MNRFREISFDPDVQRWITAVEELIGEPLTAEQQVKLAGIFAEVHQDGYKAGDRGGASRVYNAQRGQDMGQ